MAPTNGRGDRPLPLSERIRLVVLTGLVLVALIVAEQVVVGVQALRATSSRATEQRDRAIKLSELLVECTTAPELRKPPEPHAGPGDCFVRQQAGTATFVAADGPLAPLLAAAAACGAAHPGDIPATTRCTRASFGLPKG